MVVVALAIGLPLLVLRARAGPRRRATTRTIIGGGLIVASLTAALGVGVGVLVRNQVAGVVGALIWLFILVAAARPDRRQPAELHDTRRRPASRAARRRPTKTSRGPAPWASLVVWALVFNVLGLIAEKRRDID